MFSEVEWSLYILSCSDMNLYTGIAISVQERIHHHNHTKRGAKYTRGRRPVTFLFSWKIGNRTEAMRAERKFKKLSRKEKFRAIETGKLPFEI